MKRTVIISVFVGRRENLKLLFPLLETLLNSKLVDHVHLWDFTRDSIDSAWIRENMRGGFTLFEVADKSLWKEYYAHYTARDYPNTILIKSDDDIVFIDVESFQSFIDYRSRDLVPLLLFPSIVNNGVCAHLQQKCGLMKDDGGHEFENDPGFGSLWASGEIAGRLHRDFWNNKDEWLSKTRSCGVKTIELGQRISVNFFAILSEDIDAVYGAVARGYDDEVLLTTTIPRELSRHLDVYMGFTVAHLSFYKQRETGLDEPMVLKMYSTYLDDLKSTYLNANNLEIEAFTDDTNQLLYMTKKCMLPFCATATLTPRSSYATQTYWTSYWA